MDDTYEHDKSSFETKDDATLYIDGIRLVEGGHVKRFEYLARKFDIVEYELNDGASKSLLFYAIEHNNETFVKLLLDMEIPLDKKYSVRNTCVFFLLFFCLLSQQLLKIYISPRLLFLLLSDYDSNIILSNG